uniref:Platelet-derived growth factor (PDGF) family profile domain-containing protein n=1 Tax=Canis lupus familiaris TaxID=9615 RepID=A0A8C0SIH6_CANLF
MCLCALNRQGHSGNLGFSICQTGSVTSRPEDGGAAQVAPQRARPTSAPRELEPRPRGPLGPGPAAVAGLPHLAAAPRGPGGAGAQPRGHGRPAGHRAPRGPGAGAGRGGAAAAAAAAAAGAGAVGAPLPRARASPPPPQPPRRPLPGLVGGGRGWPAAPPHSRPLKPGRQRAASQKGAAVGGGGCSSPGQRERPRGRAGRPTGSTRGPACPAPPRPAGRSASGAPAPALPAGPRLPGLPEDAPATCGDLEAAVRSSPPVPGAPPGGRAWWFPLGTSWLGTSEKMPAMRLFTCFLQLLAGLALPAMPPQQLALSAGNGSSEVEVVPFQQVWGRSYCRALEKLVDVLSEYPDEVEHMFNPSCVSLLRCSGCCGDENLHCMPVETANVTMQLLMIHSTGRPSYVELTFSQHIRCQCRPPLEDMKLERRRPKGRGKRKREKQRPTDCHLAYVLVMQSPTAENVSRATSWWPWGGTGPPPTGS